MGTRDSDKEQGLRAEGTMQEVHKRKRSGISREFIAWEESGILPIGNWFSTTRGMEVPPKRTAMYALAGDASSTRTSAQHSRVTRTRSTPDISLERFRHPLSDLQFKEECAILQGEEESLRRVKEGRNGENVASLQEELDALGARIIKRRSLVSSFRKVPREVWMEVFWWAWVDENNPISIQSRCRVLATSFSHTCYQWKDVAENFPTLWSRLRIDWPELTREDAGEMRMDILDAVLERAKQKRMSVQIYSSRNTNVTVPHQERICTLLTSICERCGELDICGDATKFRPIAGRDVSFPKLEILFLGIQNAWHWKWTSPSSHRLVERMLNAKSLETLSIQELCWLNSDTPLPFADGLVSLISLPVIMISQVVRLQATCSNLRHLEVTIGLSGMPADQGPALFPRLHMLVVAYIGSNPCLALNHIDAPILRTLKLGLRESDRFAHSLLGFLQPSSCSQLHELALEVPQGNTSADKAHWSEIFKRIPELECLLNPRAL
ncbi:hypothetical protein V5O48_017814 [Marasmius crinis-equi]|uniref:F-box domain-containing protein n=1 Tax=Marasmius crinis-equi TaxID=585013 RepID=A0ABR3EMX7_9AGAR